MEENIKKYTIIEPDPTLKTNLMAFGFDCGAGWHPMIYELLDKIQDIVDANPEYKDIRVTQIKEKFGGLRVYLNFEPDDIWTLIDEYQEKSFNICEECGAENSEMRIIHGWFTILCDACFSKPNKSTEEEKGE